MEREWIAKERKSIAMEAGTQREKGYRLYNEEALQLFDDGRPDAHVGPDLHEKEIFI